MSQLNDAKLAYYNTFLGTTGSLNDQELAWLCNQLSVSPPSGQVNDRWGEYLISLGYSGQLNDLLYAWLTDLGFLGSLNDKLLAFYSNEPETVAFIERVLADGGTVEDEIFLNSFIQNAKANNYYDDIVTAYSPSWGVKGTTTASKLYSIIAAAKDLEQAVGASQPIINLADLNGRTRLLFDGADDRLGPTAFVTALPVTVILGGLEQESWTANDRLFDGSSNPITTVYLSATTPKTRIFADGLSGSEDSNLPIGTPRSCRFLFNGASSETQIAGESVLAANIAAVSMTGFTLGAGPATNPSNISVGLVVKLNAAIDAAYPAKVAAIRAFNEAAYGTT